MARKTGQKLTPSEYKELKKFWGVSPKNFSQFFTKKGADIYANPGVYGGLKSVQDIMRKNQLGNFGTVTGGPAGIVEAGPVAPPTDVSGATSAIPSYQDFLSGAGSPYANLYSDQTLAQDYNPYYDNQVAAQEYQRQLAQQDLSRGITDITKAEGQSASSRGLFGSGIYQQELNQQLGDLNQNFERNYGVGKYTPYSQRKFEIEQQRKTAIEQARLARQGQAWNAYQQQYYPTLASGV